MSGQCRHMCGSPFEYSFALRGRDTGRPSPQPLLPQQTAAPALALGRRFLAAPAKCVQLPNRKLKRQHIDSCIFRYRMLRCDKQVATDQSLPLRGGLRRRAAVQPVPEANSVKAARFWGAPFCSSPPRPQERILIRCLRRTYVHPRNCGRLHAMLLLPWWPLPRTWRQKAPVFTAPASPIARRSWARTSGMPLGRPPWPWAVLCGSLSGPGVTAAPARRLERRALRTRALPTGVAGNPQPQQLLARPLLRPRQSLKIQPAVLLAAGREARFL